MPREFICRTPIGKDDPLDCGACVEITREDSPEVVDELIRAGKLHLMEKSVYDELKQQNEEFQGLHANYVKTKAKLAKTLGLIQEILAGNHQTIVKNCPDLFRRMYSVENVDKSDGNSKGTD